MTKIPRPASKPPVVKKPTKRPPAFPNVREADRRKSAPIRRGR